MEMIRYLTIMPYDGYDYDGQYGKVGTSRYKKIAFILIAPHHDFFFILSRMPWNIH